jgi:hypothetical protein
LLALHNNFEGFRGSILHHSPLFSVNSVISELLAEKIYLPHNSHTTAKKNPINLITCITVKTNNTMNKAV